MKGSNKILAIVFLALLAIFVINKVFFKPSTKSFREYLVQIDTTNVDKITILNQLDGILLTLEKTDTGWKAGNGTLSVTAAAGSVEPLLAEMSGIKTQRLIAKSNEKWPDFEVGEAKGSYIKAYEGDKKLADFVVGRLNFNQQARTATSYMRNADEDDVYAINGFQSMIFKRNFDSFRDKTLVKVKKEDILQLIVENEFGTNELSNKNGLWLLNNTTALDSVKMDNYLSSLSNLNGMEFDDAFDTQLANPIQSIRIKANNRLDELVVNCYRSSGTPGQFILHSSLNPTAYFKSDSSGIYQRLFEWPVE